MANANVDLASVFSAVSKALRQNKESINQADTYNHDHGSNMVKTFATITKAMKANQEQGQGQALAQAAEALNKKATSSSSKLYANGLQQAAQQIHGDRVDPQMAMQVLQSLLGAGQTQDMAAPSSQASGGQLGDLLGSLLGNSSPGNSQQPSVGSQPSAGGDLLGSLLSGFGQNQTTQQAGGLQDGLDLGDLLTAGMAFMQSKQSGANTVNSLVAAFTAASGMGSAPHRQQSTQLVANSFLQALQKYQQ